jgi:Uma2 family endonuclease
MSVTADSSTSTRPHGLTWEEFIELPEELLRHAELHDGEVVEMASPGRPHQLALVNLIGFLFPWTRANGGELVTDPHVRIAERWGYQPDLAWYAPERVPASGYWTEAPNLAVEILSPTTRRIDVLRKPRHYLQAGVQQVWFVDVDEFVVHVLHPDGSMEEHGLDAVLTSSLLPGLEVPVNEVITDTVQRG